MVDSPGTNHLLANLRIDLGKLAEQAGFVQDKQQVHEGWRESDWDL